MGILIILLFGAAMLGLAGVCATVREKRPCKHGVIGADMNFKLCSKCFGEREEKIIMGHAERIFSSPQDDKTLEEIRSHVRRSWGTGP